MFTHHISLEQIELLEKTFAKLTLRGWKIPEWVELLRKTATS